MSLHSVLIENWPRLQCTNIYLTLNSEQLVQQAQLHLTQTQIRLTFPDDDDKFTADIIIAIPPTLCVQIDTLSQLVKQSKHLSFRLSTNRAHAFDEEYLCKIMPNTRISGHKRLKLVSSIQPNDLVRLKCVGCDHWLSEVVGFQRVLELPSDNIDSADWFCHHHNPANGNGHSHSHSDGDAIEELRELGAVDGKTKDVQNFTKIAARPMDLLYGQFYFVVSVERLGGAKLIRNDVHCDDCYQKLGEFHGNNETVKLWNEHVVFRVVKSSDNLEKPLFAGPLFTQFLFIVRKVIEDFDFLWSTVSLPQTIRCLFETQRKGAHRTYLLVQVMNKNLEMWRSSTETPCEQLVRFEGMKILFQVVDHRAADPNDTSVVVPVPPLILSWENDSTVNHIRISDDMIDEAIRRLEERTDCIPSVYQRIGGNGFRLSYLYDV